VNSKIIISKYPAEFSEEFARILVDGLKSSGEYFHIALSGGSTPKLLYKFLAENYKSKIEWSKIKIFWGDERCVPPDDPESNYKMTRDSLLSEIEIPDKNVFRIEGENDPSEEAARYSGILARNIPQLNNLPEFDLVLLGLGEDGHTASIFSNSLQLFESKNLCVAAEHPGTHQKRITITGPVINNAKQVVFLATGSGKSSVVDIIINKKNGFDKLPAAYVNPHHGDLIWLLDDDAGRNILPY